MEVAALIGSGEKVEAAIQQVMDAFNVSRSRAFLALKQAREAAVLGAVEDRLADVPLVYSIAVMLRQGIEPATAKRIAMTVFGVAISQEAADRALQRAQVLLDALPAQQTETP
jgi:hypothetical protein